MYSHRLDLQFHIKEYASLYYCTYCLDPKKGSPIVTSYKPGKTGNIVTWKWG